MSAAPPGRRLFGLAALFNWSIAASLAWAGSPAWTLLGMRPPAEPFFLHGFLVMVVVFGCAYFWISREPAGKEALIAVSIGGKLAIFALVLAHVVAGKLTLMLLGPAVGDAIFAVLFFRFLRR